MQSLKTGIDKSCPVYNKVSLEYPIKKFPHMDRSNIDTAKCVISSKTAL